MPQLKLLILRRRPSKAASKDATLIRRQHPREGCGEGFSARCVLRRLRFAEHLCSAAPAPLMTRLFLDVRCCAGARPAHPKQR